MKKMTTLVTFALTVTLATASPPPPSGGGGVQQVDRIYDFGEIGIDFYVYHDFMLVNLSDAPVKLDSVIADCECSRVWVPDSTIMPGDTGRITLRFHSKNYYGKTSKAMQVYTDNPVSPKLEYFYLSMVGQWLMGIKPDPISVFFLPSHASRTLTISNPVLERIKLSEMEQHDDLVQIRVVQAEAGKGKSLELEVTPRDGLQKGTYESNFRVTVELGGDYEPVRMTLPVKIVRY
ncbi:MAG TPA: DUF1573 domain-containing protein [Acidobacteriota bacterium]|nr:DUF1573 domain-containing protein [Acidobacteriota bacterium]